MTNFVDIINVINLKGKTFELFTCPLLCVMVACTGGGVDYWSKPLQGKIKSVKFHIHNLNFGYKLKVLDFD